uniref:Uncharacterized protein n=1 Tax=Ascaris lumbricoides TaxID=6252 RepID=A0A0M3HJP7_ASCLU
MVVYYVRYRHFLIHTKRNVYHRNLMPHRKYASVIPFLKSPLLTALLNMRISFCKIASVIFSRSGKIFPK